jgi:hypothetical protein
MEITNESVGCVSGKIKLFSGPGTRQWPRFNITDVPFIKEVSSYAGSRLRIANISRAGALLLTKGRLIRGTRLKLKVVTSEGTIPLFASVLRSLVFTPKGIPRYQAAVVFDRPLQILDHDSRLAMDTKLAISIHPSPSDTFPPATNASFRNSSQSEDLLMIAAFLALNFYTEQYARMHEELKLNDW